MDYPSSEFLIRFAVATGTFATLLTVMMVGLMLVVRVTGAYEHWANNQTFSRWITVLEGGSMGAQANLTSLGKRSAFHLLRQWNHYVSRARSLDDPAEVAVRLQHLRNAARHVELAPFALELLESGTNEEVMAAAIALGNLELEKAWIPLKRRTALPHPFISIAAMQALVRIDAERALPMLVTVLTTHAEWPDHVLAHILEHLDELQLHTVISGVTDGESFDAVLHLYRALERIGDPAAAVVLEWLLDRVRTHEDLLACCYATLQEDRLNTVLAVVHARRPEPSSHS